MDWLQITSIISQIASSTGAIIALFVFAHELRSDRDSRDYESFITLLERYDDLIQKRHEAWDKVKSTTLGNDKEKFDVVDDWGNTIDFLEIRISQKEIPLYPFEYKLAQVEFRSLNFLDELCGLALKNKRAKSLLLLTNSNDISYYQNRVKQLTDIYYEAVKINYRFFKPQTSSLVKIDVSKM